MDKNKKLSLEEMLKFAEKIKDWSYYNGSGGEPFSSDCYSGVFEEVYVRITWTEPAFFGRYRTYYELSVFVNDPDNRCLSDIILGYYKTRRRGKIDDEDRKILQLYERLKSNRLRKEYEKEKVKVEDALKKVRGD